MKRTKKVVHVTPKNYNLAKLLMEAGIRGKTLEKATKLSSACLSSVRNSVDLDDYRQKSRMARMMAKVQPEPELEHEPEVDGRSLNSPVTMDTLEVLLDIRDLLQRIAFTLDELKNNQI